MTEKIAEIIGWNGNQLKAWKNEEEGYYHGNIEYTDDNGYSRIQIFQYSAMDELIKEIKIFIEQNPPKWYDIEHDILKRIVIIKGKYVITIP